MSRRSLLAAVRDCMRTQTPVPEARESAAARTATPPRRPSVRAPDLELEQLEAEARYHRDRFQLYRARVISGSGVAASTTRLRELERTATAAADRLAHARRARSTAID
jgi:hypothetical protein